MSDIIAELSGKHPHHKVINLPLDDCPVCKGKGEYRNQLQSMTCCLCVCLSSKDSFREAAVEALQKACKP